MRLIKEQHSHNDHVYSISPKPFPYLVIYLPVGAPKLSDVFGLNFPLFDMNPRKDKLCPNLHSRCLSPLRACLLKVRRLGPMKREEEKICPQDEQLGFLCLATCQDLRRSAKE